MDISGQWFLANQTVWNGISTQNLFKLKRGYLTFKKDFNHIFSVRFTQDITLDQEGEDAGNIEMQLKYLYLKINLGDFWWLTNTFVEIGMVHRPWIDFEEHMNQYRVQGPMYLESFHLVNSADFGITMVSLLGGKINDTYQQRVNHSYPGRYGSWSLGILNGGGYHAVEKNRNKLIETRLSLRPFPDVLPGFQLSYHGAWGAGNVTSHPKYRLNHIYLSYESPGIITALQAHSAIGNSFGTYLSPDELPQRSRGVSFFTEVYILRQKLSLVGNISHFQLDSNGWVNGREIMAGISYHFLNNQKLLLDFERCDRSGRKYSILEAALEIRF